MKKQHNVSQIIIMLLFIGIAIGIALFSVWGTIIPFTQTSSYLKFVERKGVLTEQSLSQILSQKDIFTPYTPYQRDIRSDLLAKTIALSSKQLVDSVLLERVISLAKEAVVSNAPQAEQLADIGQAYLLLARNKGNDQEILAQSKSYYEQALKLWPDSQNVLFAYIAVLVNQGDFVGAERVVNAAIDLDPEVGLSYYYRGFVAIRKGSAHYNQALGDFSKALEQEGFRDNSLKTFYQMFLSHYYQLKDVQRVRTVVETLATLDQDQSELYQAIVKYIDQKGFLPALRFN